MYAQILIGVSLVAGAYQDIRERAVNDLVWLPAVVGVAYLFYSLYPHVEAPLVRMLIFGGISLVGALLGRLGQADPIAWTVLAADPSQLSPLFPLAVGAVLLLAHILYEHSRGNLAGGLNIPMRKFLAEQRWIPKAIITKGERVEVGTDVNSAREEVEKKGTPDSMVEVTYGVPHIAYFGIGYAVYLVYLLAFSPQTILVIP